MNSSAAIAATVILVAGCGAPGGPVVLELDERQYARAFDAALEAAKEQGLEPVVVDRSLGVIETDSRSAGSLLEPWRSDNAGIADALAHTVNFERRRARFEFVPEPFEAPVPDVAGQAQGPALPGSDRAESRFDLVAWKGPVQLRTWVMVDRQFRPNMRYGTWSLREANVPVDPLAAADRQDTTTKTPTEWTPIGRDVQYERLLTSRVAELLHEPEGSNPDATANPDR